MSGVKILSSPKMSFLGLHTELQETACRASVVSAVSRDSGRASEAPAKASCPPPTTEAKWTVLKNMLIQT